MRIRIVQRPSETSIDGVRLDRFEPGYQYEVGNSLGAVMLAERWAVPVAADAPALVIPFSETDPFATAYQDADAPSNLVREHYPPYLDNQPETAFDFRRRRRPRLKT
jgi:hypothetical protein